MIFGGCSPIKPPIPSVFSKQILIEINCFSKIYFYPWNTSIPIAFQPLITASKRFVEGYRFIAVIKVLFVVSEN
jgi:hypothetical protein